jgi:CRISPR-associated protein Csx17
MMTDKQHELVLHGVRPEPLASYLKGLGIIRLVAQQKEPGLRAFWRDDELVLVTGLGMRDLLDFFLTEYRPTPIVSPWHGSCGFFPETDTLRHLRDTADLRFAAYGAAIRAMQKILGSMAIDEKPDKAQARVIMRELRNAVPDDCLEWLDAAFVLTDAGAALPPLLGTGGNDGHLEFAHNFMQRLDDLLLSGHSRDFLARDQLVFALGGAAETSAKGLLDDAAVGQFSPGAAGGANLSSGFGAPSLVDPWDYVLLLEGTVLFAGAATRSLRRTASNQAAAPFSVTTSAAGYGTAAAGEEAFKTSRGELWVPLWSHPLSLAELRHLFGEGRATVGASQAASGLEFSIAVASLGVDQNIAQFVRYGFLMRNGLAYAASPLGRFDVHANVHASLLEGLIPWLRKLRSAVGDGAPAGARSARRVLEDGVMEYARTPAPVRAQGILCSLASLHRTVARSRLPEWFRPLWPLSAEWLAACDDNSPEYALAFSVAAWVATCRTCFLRELVLPVGRDNVGRFVWDPERKHDVVDTDEPLHSLELLLRSIMAAEATHSARIVSGWAAPWEDVSAFIDGRVDAGRVLELITALSLVDVSAFWGSRVTRRPSLPGAPLPAVYCHLKPFFAPEAQFARPDGSAAPLQATAPMLAALERHEVAEAANAARLALAARGMVPVGTVRGGRTDLYHGPRWPVSTVLNRHLFAGLLFPVDKVDRVLAQCLRPISKEAWL